jgi:hypothetical protein
VTAVFHAHDHCYCHQELDGIVYQECPQVSSSQYQVGFCQQGKYLHGLMLPNSGHLRVSVGPERIHVEYVRAFLPGDGENGVVADSYDIGLPSPVPEPVGASGAGASAGQKIRVGPVPCRGTLWVRCLVPGPGTATLSLHDVSGRVVRTLQAPIDAGPAGLIRWPLSQPGRQPLPSGVYTLLWEHGAEREAHKILVLH